MLAIELYLIVLVHERGRCCKQLQRRRSEVVERTFAHLCETGGARRSWLREIGNVGKRYLLQAAAHNLGIVLRKLLGAGKPREFAAICAHFVAAWVTLQRLWYRWGSTVRREMFSGLAGVNFPMQGPASVDHR